MESKYSRGGGGRRVVPPPLATCLFNQARLYIGRDMHGRDNHRKPNIQLDGARRRRNFWEKRF